MKETETKKTEKKVKNPHDIFFKDTFSNPLVARDFIENYLPESILKMTPETFSLASIDFKTLRIV